MFALTLLAIGIVFAALLWLVLRADGLALFAPKSTKGIVQPAHTFCVGWCRSAEGRCPLGYSEERLDQCPLWRFVAADLPTVSHGSPFAHLQSP